jgi:hypothetical protein
MANNQDLVASDLKQYAINLLDFIADESELQFEKWNKYQTGFLSELVKAHGSAAKAQNDVLRKWNEDIQLSFQRSMFLLSMLGIVATGWLAPALEQWVGPRFFTQKGDWANTVGFGAKRIETASPFKSSMFGNVGKDVANYFITVAQAGLQSADTPYVAPNSDRIAKTPSEGEFAQTLYTEVDGQRKQITKAIKAVAQNINNSTTFGYAMWKLLLKKNPRCPSLPLQQAMTAGRECLNELVGRLRQELADRYIYYGQDPPQPKWMYVYSQLEKRLWAIWIVEQHLHAKTIDIMGGIGFIVGKSGAVFSETGGIASSYKDSPIVQRLFDRNAPVQQILLKGQPATVQDSKSQIDALEHWAKQVLNSGPLSEMLQGTKRKLSPVNQLFR